MPDHPLSVAKCLAYAFLAGDWEPPAMTRRGQSAVGQRRVWVRELALAVRHGFPDAPRDRPRQLTDFIASCPPFTDAFDDPAWRPPSIRRWFVAGTAMGPARWPVVALDSVRDVKDLLGMTSGDLLWFADTRRSEGTVIDERLRHYRYHWVPKGNGGVRLIEEPKAILKHVQRVVLREILERIPVHPSAHGFRKGRSALTHAREHVQRQVVIRLDLEDFFASIQAGRVFGIFRQCGYPEPVAHLLTGLVTNSVPPQVWASAPAPAPGGVDASRRAAVRRLGVHLAHPHLPQGTPTSPALANLAAFGLDRRLAGLASAAGMTYSRYADDLAFSSVTPRSPRQADRLVERVAGIAAEEGFRINPSKTSVRRAGQRQRLAGVVVNQRLNVERGEYELVKAIVHNAVRHGPTGQNRDRHPHFRDHLRGRIAWVNQLNAARGERLLADFARIEWDDPPTGEPQP